MPNQIPSQIQEQKYISLKTFRKNGAGVPTPVWFGEQDGKIYVMTRSDLGKAKRIRNNPQVRVAPCTIRGTVTGPEFAVNLIPHTLAASNLGALQAGNRVNIEVDVMARYIERLSATL